MALLRSKLYDLELEKQRAEVSAQRKSQVRPDLAAVWISGLAQPRGRPRRGLIWAKGTSKGLAVCK
jgi:hypothetical protein